MLQPLRGKILVEVLPGNNITESGLILSPKEEVPHRGRVVSMGEPFIDRKGKEHQWGFSCGHIAHFTRQWDKQKISHYIIRRDQIFSIEHEGKAYAIGEYIIIRKLNDVGGSLIYVPKHFESEVMKQTELAEVLSVGREDRLGVKVGDRLLIYRNEGLSVRIPQKEELWSCKPRAILAVVNQTSPVSLT